jgi:hypothetical protein
MKIFIGGHKHTAVLAPESYRSLNDFYTQLIKDPPKGEKGGAYFTTASKIRVTKAVDNNLDGRDRNHYRRRNKTHLASWCVCIDGDSTTFNDKSCLPIGKVHKCLRQLNVNHIIYTTASYIPKTRNRWRCILPCNLSKRPDLKYWHKATVDRVYKILYKHGCSHLKRSTESFRLSNMWFLPVLSLDNKGIFKSYKFLEGKFIKPVSPDKIEKTIHIENEDYSTEQEIVDRILNAESPLHDSINKYIFGNIHDGRQPGAIKATLHGLTGAWDLNDSKLANYKKDIDRQVDAAYKKFSIAEDNDYWRNKKVKNSKIRIYTDYPDQGGMMENFVQFCMKWQRFPNRQIAVTAVRTIISTLGARVYTLENGKGVALTALITGRSTIGKSDIKKFFLWVMRKFQLLDVSQEFLGSIYYTSVKNLVDELKSKYSLLSIRTESGQTDKSAAGDMSRVMAYELEFSTESGIDGYIASGAQNDKIPALYSPAVTTIRESVAKIQSDADALNQSLVAGALGRRSTIIIDLIKQKKNRKRVKKLPKSIKKLITNLYELAANDNRKDCTKPLKKDLWTIVKIADDKFLEEKELIWLKKENNAAEIENDYESTFYGRLYERVPVYAATLAIADNPIKPIITNEHLNIAEKSLEAELYAHRQQEDFKVLAEPMDKLIMKVVETFTGSMAPYYKYYDKKLRQIAKSELSAGAMEWTALRHKLGRYINNLEVRDKNKLVMVLKNRLPAEDIIILSPEQTKEKFNHTRMTLQRI